MQDEPRRYRFGPYLVDTARASVFRDHERLGLRPKAFDALVYLIRNAGRLVMKDDLIASLWPDVVVTEDSLFKCIREARNVLGDTDGSLIRTVPRRGYVFEAAVDVESGDSDPVTSLRARRRFQVQVAAIAATAAIAAFALLEGWVGTEAPGPAPVNRFSYSLPDAVSLGAPAISPDGRLLVIATDEGLYSRPMSGLETTLIPGTEGPVANPFFSPDGQTIAYWSSADKELRRIAIDGGAALPIARGLGSPVMGASWAADGTIFAGQASGIVRIAAGGGGPKLIVPAKDGERLFGPSLLPDGDSVLFSSASGSSVDVVDIVVASLATGERRTVHSGGGNVRYSPSGHLLYEEAGGLFAVAFDIETLGVSGAARWLESGVATSLHGNTGPALFGVSNEGTLVYLERPGSSAATPNRALVWTDRAGNDTAVGLPSCACFEVDLSPDGARLAFSAFDGQLTETDIWLWSVEAQRLARLTPERGVQHFVVWSPDGRTIVYQSDYLGIFARAADGTGTVEQLFENPYGRAITSPFSLDPAGDVLFTAGLQDIHVLKLSGNGTDVPLLNDEHVEHRPALSPDGAWLVYESDETGVREIYLRRYPDVDAGSWKISSGGGTDARWSADGDRIYFLGETHLMEVRLHTEPELWKAEPKALFEFPRRAYWRGPNGQHHYDVSADGERFVRIKRGFVEAGQGRVVIVQNWTADLVGAVR